MTKQARRHNAPFILALFISSLLHLAIVSLPYLGQSNPATHKSKLSQAKPQPTLIARLQHQQRALLSQSNTTASSQGEARLLKPTIHTDAATEAADEVTELTQATPVEDLSHTVSTEEQPNKQAHEGADILPLQAPEFYPVEQLSQRPQAVTTTDLDPPEISPLIASGQIILKLWISDVGEVIQVDIEKTDLPEVFSQTVISGFKRLQFTPGVRDGRPVGSTLRIEVTYDDGRAPPSLAP